MLAVSCDKPYKGEPVKTHAILIYMAGDNNLSKYCTKNIITISDGIKLSPSEHNSIYVYYDMTDLEPRLIRLYKSKGSIRCDTIVKYNEANSAAVEQLSLVIYDAFAGNCYDSYGLVLWSHATGWLPSNFFDGEAATQSFGIDSSREMDIKDMAMALPDHFFEYIVFDACSMGSVEVVYQLRNKAEFILSTTTEIAADGLPYRQIIPMLFDENRNYERIANKCYNYYINTLETGIALSLVATSKMESLAATVKQIYANHVGELVNTDSIQHFDRYFGNMFLFYDLEMIVKTIATTEELEYFQNHLKKVVLSAQTSPSAYRIPINTYCGLSSYIFGLNAHLDNYYTTLNWYIDTH